MANHPENHHQSAPTYIGQTIDQQLGIINKFYTFKLIHKQKDFKIIARILMVLLVITLITMFIPWQQNIRANGGVTAFKPGERPQPVTSTIDGMIEFWFVQEGQFVHKGDTIAKISEIKDKYFDPKTIDRYREQVLAKTQSVNFIEEKVKALRNQILALKDGMRLSIEKAHNKVLQAQMKVKIDSADFVNANQDNEIALQRYKRQEELYKEGLRSLADLESRQLKLQETKAKYQIYENKFALSRNELLNARIELNAVRADYETKISKAESDLNEAIYNLNDAKGSLAKIQNESENISIRNSFYYIRAPQDGLIIKAQKSGIGETIKQGEVLVTIMPQKHDLAVELYVSATDVPLLQKGRKVRLQFDGWPALQFSGWPSVSVGTFGGEIAVIDFVSSKEGKYRVLVTPDPNDVEWPIELRMGSGVYGWAMLDEVPIWYEIWRQFNGFPPSLKEKPDFETDFKKKSKDSEGDSE